MLALRLGCLLFIVYSRHTERSHIRPVIFHAVLQFHVFQHKWFSSLLKMITKHSLITDLYGQHDFFLSRTATPRFNLEKNLCTVPYFFVKLCLLKCLRRSCFLKQIPWCLSSFSSTVSSWVVWDILTKEKQLATLKRTKKPHITAKHFQLCNELVERARVCGVMLEVGAGAQLHHSTQLHR